MSEVSGKGYRFAIVASRWNEEVTDGLVSSALEALEAAGAEDVTVVRVPGAWEIPVVVGHLIHGPFSRERPAPRALFDKRPQTVIALGCVLQGETSHAGLLAGTVCDALMEIQVNSGVPITWGIVTADTMEIAMERRHRGKEAAETAIEMANLLS